MDCENDLISVSSLRDRQTGLDPDPSGAVSVTDSSCTPQLEVDTATSRRIPLSEVIQATSSSGNEMPEGAGGASGCGGKRAKKARKEGMRGKCKEKWTDHERRMLWECYVRSGGKKAGGYIQKLKDMWNRKGLKARGVPSLLSQLKQIETNNLLTLMVREEIGKKVRNEKVRDDDDDDTEDGNGGYVDSDEEAIVVREGIGELTEEEWTALFGDSDDETFEGFLEEGVQGDPVVRLDRVDVWKSGDLVRALTKEETDVLARLREVFHSDKTIEVPSMKSVDRRKVKAEVDLIEGVIHNLVREGMSVTEVNRLLYAGSYMVADRLGMLRRNRKGRKDGRPYWQRRLEERIVRWRKDIGRVKELKGGGVLAKRARDELERRYGILANGLKAVSAMLREKIRAGATKIRNFVGRSVARRQNNLFRNNQSQLYKELSGANKTGDANSTPDADGTREFWSRIWSVDKQHNDDACWLGEVRTRMEGIRQMEDVVVTLEDVQSSIRKMANWKAPGPDGVRGFWFKKFQCLHSPIASALQEMVVSRDVPEWLVKGRTVLVQKDAAKGTVASNYRPIACLPLMWKLLTGIFADKLYDHLLINNVLPDEQKGCRRRSRGTKDQLLIDKAVLQEVRRKKRHLSVAWIDYKKAYDMVPHSWIQEVLHMMKVAGNVSELLERSMGQWKTVLTANGEVLGEVEIRRGIFQGDSLSPLLFIMVMIPLSILLKREGMGYPFGCDGKLLNHLLFMDDLKVFGKSEREMEALVELVRVYSNDIGMEFGIDKCAVLVMERGMKVRREGIMLPNGELMKEIDSEGYRYLGVLEGADIMNREMKDKVRKEYLRRVKLVAKSKLYGGHLIRAVNAWAVSVVRYSAGVLEWSDRELRQMDVRTRKLLTMFGVFHIRSSVARLYMKRKDGGRGLMSVLDCVRAEEISLNEYLVASDEWMLKVAASNVEVGEDKTEYMKRVDKERADELAGKKLHGKFLQDVKEVADGRSWQWLRAGYLAKSTEAFLFAAQEQALRTRLFRRTIEGDKDVGDCRVCGKVAESVAHLAAGCSGLAQREYRRRHDRMGLRIYWELCRKFGVKCAGKWFEEVPNEVRVSEDGNVEIWWDRNVMTTKQLEHNRPDVVVIDRAARKWLIVDFAVPWDKNVVTKEDEKMAKYSPLALEVRRVYGVETKVVPVVVGALGVVSKRLEGYLKVLGVPDVLGGLQTSAIIGTTNILRKTLSL